MTGDRNASLLAEAARIFRHTPLEELEAAIYDALASSSASGAAEMKALAKKLGKVLVSFTPNGSEYYVKIGDDYFVDAEACRRAIQRRIDSQFESMKAALLRAKEAEKAIRALPLPDPVPAWRPKVKELVWRVHGKDRYANAEVGQYSVGLVGAGYVAILSRINDGWQYDVDIARNAATLGEALAAAQADYEARILSTLDVPPPPQIDGGHDDA